MGAILRTGLLVLLLGVVVACDDPVPDIEVEGYDACSDEAYRTEQHFTDVMIPRVFDPYCSYCHWSDREGAVRQGAPATLNYDDFESATRINTVTWERVRSRDMPPLARTPSTEELHLLVDWLNCTSPEPDRNLVADLADDCPDDTLTFADAAPIFDANCTRCHSSELAVGERGGAPESADYDTAQGVREVGLDFVWSRMFNVEMPFDAPTSMSTEDKLELYDWLSCGGPD